MMADRCVEPPAADQHMFLVEWQIPTLYKWLLLLGSCLKKDSLKDCSILITLGNANLLTTIIWTDTVTRAL